MSIESSQVADDEYPAPRFKGISLFIPIVVAAVTPPTPTESKIATKKIFWDLLNSTFKRMGKTP
jgi:hypothetical protein